VFDMNVKEFLKPNVKKIILFLIMFALLAFLSFKLGRVYEDPYKYIPEYMRPVGGLLLYKLNPILWLPAPLFSQTHNYIEHWPVDSNEIEISSIIYWLIISYLISCSIFWIYKKVKP